ncbi:hypothetical protein Geezett_066 [Klebsiella phage Geezett]|uniref:Uncharacterized protein n=1 Tax=Klebsiella phage Geezett TaxID=2861002 RepID=A0AAE7VJY9_9CAUD|nr:hypothetical protein PQZ59_gp66 [Klebsiella phage Geezett]QXV72138.1 hypothetical protein Geezett_066 [Klebsiella phage Geezett]
MRSVICFRCLNVYQPEKVKRMKTKRLKVKEPACPRCKCKVYISRNDNTEMKIIFTKENRTASEDE